MKRQMVRLTHGEQLVRHLRLNFSKQPSRKLKEMYDEYDAGTFKGWVTMTLAKILTESMKELDEAASASLQQEILFRIYVGFKKFKSKRAGASRARMFHQAIETRIAEFKRESPELAGEITCRRGCTSCCHFPVDINEDEAELLAERVREGVDIDMEQLRRQVESVPVQDGFLKLSFEHRRCVFLGKDGDCRVYADRPANCRKFFVRSDPKLCENPQNKIEQVVQAPWEEVVSSAMNLTEGGLALPAALLEELEKPLPPQ